ncbi:MAG: FadR family transcriptional regulator [Deltaproteobacteria bacterium]|nr:FadR family transcriptional regulator [Deltaproteobacteria bacterium]MBW1817937.1 FadR family transcriptional regulator [Deltaproteobacteria bacterium]
MTDTSHMFTPVKSRRSFEAVAINIKELVFNGVLKPGDKLPSETRLAQDFNVGRQTIREGLRLLELSGFITIQKGGSGGATVKNTILSRISDLFLDAFRMGDIPIHELTQARLEIEKIVLKYAMMHADDTDIAALRDNVAGAKNKINRNMRATEENFVFHTLLARASKNRVLAVSVESIMAVHANFISRIGFDLEVSKSVVAFHEEILEAIETKDMDRAFQLLERHMLDVENRLQPLTTPQSHK